LTEAQLILELAHTRGLRLLQRRRSESPARLLLVLPRGANHSKSTARISFAWARLAASGRIRAQVENGGASRPGDVRWRQSPSPPPGRSTLRPSTLWPARPNPAATASAHTSGNDGSRVWQVISNLGWLTTGQRVRATMSWDACTSDPQKPLLDYDLFLFRNDAGGGGNYAGGFAFASQSISDVEEGFDFGINTDGEYILMAGWEPQSGCNNGAEEPFGWAWAVL
jgi:hypothetical protein